MPDNEPVLGTENQSSLSAGPPTGPSLTTRLTCELVERAARHSREPAIAFDSQGDCVWLNLAALGVLGLEDATPAIGRLNLRRHALAAGGGAPPEIERAFRGKAVELSAFGYDLSSVARGKGRSPRSVGSTKLVPWVEENGRVAGVYAFHQPRAEEDGFGPLSGAEGQEALLIHSIDTAKRMVRRIAHDFNNMIVAVCGYATVLEGRPQLDEDSKNLAGLIGQAGYQLAGLTDNLARFADTTSHDRTRLNLNHVIGALFDQNRDSVPEGIEVRVDLGSPMPDLLGDQAQLGAVCWNLCQNAIESMPQGGELLCQTSTLWAGDATRSHHGEGASSRYVRLRVSDTGNGMDADARAGMFDPFLYHQEGEGPRAGGHGGIRGRNGPRRTCRGEQFTRLRYLRRRVFSRRC